MGYTSTISVYGDSLIKARTPKFTPEELVDRELFAAEAKARGFEIKDTKSSNVYKVVSDYIKKNDRGIGWWFYVNKTDDPSAVTLSSDGESAKAYELDQEIADFLTFLNEHNLNLTVRIYREGEDNGDVTRYIIEDSVLISQDEAELIFPDGKGIQ